MRIFLDECVDRRYARELSGHDVKTAYQMQWAGIKNGALLSLVSKEFDVFVTVDRNLSYQQNLSGVPVAVIVLKAASNRLADLKPLTPRVLAALTSAPKGAATVIE
ncbi:MAG TPA: DUF5615 family PIN-like protein [Rhizomicrobium sp.]